MTDLTVRAVMTLDASGVPAGAATAKVALDGLQSTHAGLKTGAQGATTAMRELSAANDEGGLSAYRFSRALSELGAPMGARVLGMRELLRGSHELIEGFGLLNTAGLAIGVGFLAVVGHTTLFKDALGDLESVAGGVFDALDRMVSGTDAVAKAQARGVVAASDWMRKFQEIADAQDKLRAAQTGPDRVGPSGLASIGLGLTDFAMPGLGELTRQTFTHAVTAEERGGWARAQDELSKQYTDEFNKRFGILNPATAQQFGVSTEQLKTAKDIDEHYTRGQEEQDRRDAEQRKRDADEAAKQMFGFNTSYNADVGWKTFGEPQQEWLKHWKPSGITPFDTQAEQAFVGVNSGVGQPGFQDPAQAKLAIAEFWAEAGKVADDADAKQAEDLQKMLDQFGEAQIRRLDDVRDAFDQFGSSAITNFNNAGQAAEQFLQKLEQMALQAYIMQPISNALFGAQGTPGGGLLGSAIQSILPAPNLPGADAPEWINVSGNQTQGGFLSDVGDFVGSLFHTGGIVGATAVGTRYVHPAYFDRAPRFHSGGFAGDEVPIIAKKGEGVFTSEQMAALGSRGGAPVSVNVHNYSGQNARVQQSTDADGNMNIDVIIDQVESGIADRIHKGTSPTARAIENTYSLSRTPAR